jgi:hypothetical protein
MPLGLNDDLTGQEAQRIGLVSLCAETALVVGLGV